jgi:hypothetical protein
LQSKSSFIPHNPIGTTPPLRTQNPIVTQVSAGRQFSSSGQNPIRGHIPINGNFPISGQIHTGVQPLASVKIMVVTQPMTRGQVIRQLPNPFVGIQQYP